MKPTIYIDADACPVTAEALAVARKSRVPVIIAGNSTQNLARHIRRGDPRQPTAGFWVDPLAIGLAAMVLGRRARAIGVRGRVYTLATIDLDMHIRHEEKKVRRQGGRTKGPAPFEDDDRERFTANLQRLVDESLREEG